MGWLLNASFRNTNEPIAIAKARTAAKDARANERDRTMGSAPTSSQRRVGSPREAAERWSESRSFCSIPICELLSEFRQGPAGLALHGSGSAPEHVGDLAL